MMYKTYLVEYEKAAEESVRYAEWSIYWIKYKNCQYASTVPYCRPLTLTGSAWASYCDGPMNPFISRDVCIFGVVVANPNCKVIFGPKCEAGEQRGQHRGSAQWEKDRWIDKWCGLPTREKCADNEGYSQWAKVGLVVFAFAQN